MQVYLRVTEERSDSQILKGLLDMLVLDSLRKADNYGFGILQELGEHFAGENGVLKEQTVYPLLHRLESKGYVESYHQPGKRGTPRKFYRLTEMGREHLNERISQWRRVTSLLDRTVLKPQGRRL